MQIISHVQLQKNMIMSADMGLFFDNDIIYLCFPTLGAEPYDTCMFELSLKFEYNGEFKKNIPNLELERCHSYNKTIFDDKNYSIVKINNINKNTKQFIFTDWYYDDGVYFINAYSKRSSSKKNRNKWIINDFEKIIISYTDNKIIKGNGSSLPINDADTNVNKGITPYFSFTAPHIKIGVNFLIDVGHIKIPVDIVKTQYVKYSNIDIFRCELVNYMSTKYPKRYSVHHGMNYPLYGGYHYLMYFIYYLMI